MLTREGADNDHSPVAVAGGYRQFPVLLKKRLALPLMVR
jgi:hypothetical protein